MTIALAALHRQVLVGYDGVKAPAVSFELYIDVILTRDIQESDLRTDDVETVVECHTVVGADKGYSVERPSASIRKCSTNAESCERSIASTLSISVISESRMLSLIAWLS
ncbi:MAG TPA: hypothetical protein VGQ10_02220 [Vicinamibacterales bacterium]|nr:hypothetical protein [Vicinamibacterales bacterium]